MPRIAVCSLALLPDTIGRLSPWGVVSLLSPGSMIATPDRLDPDRHLKLDLHDIAVDADGHVAPGSDHVAQLIGFAEAWDQSDPLLIHCWAGVSRSTAAAFIVACAASPEADEAALARRIRTLSPTATPNPLLVSHGDALLGRGGRMVAAVAALGQGEACWEGVPFEIPARWSP